MGKAYQKFPCRNEKKAFSYEMSYLVETLLLSPWSGAFQVPCWPVVSWKQPAALQTRKGCFDPFLAGARREKHIHTECPLWWFGAEHGGLPEPEIRRWLGFLQELNLHLINERKRKGSKYNLSFRVHALFVVAESRASLGGP
jgi:hypothetical protein